ncbi:hypothetical protein LTR36_005108 [Oleoguttula mirabilis]|uniref:Uncharacterized protein n=1 Tax=Oleoguttula mirabilis TaxID=1507867 RepID=A0AAV9JVP6_9PEZI|nr:hypothetical protein LTR36_005108 [Oleoguttula mirabilis]
METRGTSTPRSSSRSKRSTTNLSNLRLAPLSTKFADLPSERVAARSPYDRSPEVRFSRQHSSYLQGKSAPSTPGILSRNSSRRHQGGGLSRRGSLYENEDAPYQYAAVTRDESGGLRLDVGSGRIPKAKSEAALVMPQRLSAQGVPLRKRCYGGSKTGTSTPRMKSRPRDADDDWLTRTRASTNALLQEAKGQSWLASRDSSTSLAHLESDSDEDEGYEEMAAMSASHPKLQPPGDFPSPASARVKSPMWGSRYGSRAASRRTSRHGSMTGLRTPMRGPPGGDVVAGYFDEEPLALPMEPDFVDMEGDDTADESEVARLTGARSFGLGGIVDSLMGYNLFKVDEREETTDTDESEVGVKDRVAAEAKWRRGENDRLTSCPPAPEGGGEQGEGGWRDAAWLLSVASKALF